MAFSLRSLFPTFGRLWDRLRRQSSEDTEDPEKYWDESVKLTLAKLIDEQESRSLGTVQVFTLSQFRDSIGTALWKKYKDKILIIVETTMQRMIGRGNTIIPQENETWLLVFNNASIEDAEAQADEIARVIGQKLVGMNFTDQELPIPKQARLDLSSALNEDGSINVEAIRAAVAKTRAIAVSAPPVMATKQEVYKPAIRQGVKKEAVAKEPKQKVKQEVITLPVPDDISISFLPCWSGDSQSIDTYLVRVRTGDDENSTDALNVRDELKSAANCIAAGEALIKTVKRLSSADVRAVLALPVPIHVAFGPLRDELIKSLSVIPTAQRMLHLRFDILDVDAHTDLTKLEEACQAFKKSGARDVGVWVRWSDQNQNIQEVNRVVVCSDLTNAERTSTYGFTMQLEFFVSGAGAHRTCLTGLGNRGEVSLALKAGASQVGGKGLVDEVKEPPRKIVSIFREKLQRGS